jgi:hypothetical protein
VLDNRCGWARTYLVKAALLGICFVLVTGRASAQAFVPPAREGNVTISYQDPVRVRPARSKAGALFN